MHSTLRSKLLWLIAGRAAAITLVLGSAILIQIKSPGVLPIDPFFVLIGITYALTAVYSVLLNHSERYRWLVDLQLGCDAVIVSAIVYLTGGVASYFSPLYTLPIIAGEHDRIAPRRGDGRRPERHPLFGAGAGAVLRAGHLAGRRRSRAAAAGSGWRGSRSASTCSGSSPSRR